MAYDVDKIIKLEALKALAERITQQYPSKNAMATAIAKAISESKHVRFEKADQIPTVEEAEPDVFYLVYNETSTHYDIYVLIDNDVVLLDDTTVDLSNYVTQQAQSSALEGKVDVQTGKQLSSNDYTNTDKEKLSGISEEATKVEKSDVNGHIKIDGEDVQIYDDTTIKQYVDEHNASFTFEIKDDGCLYVKE